MPSLTIRNVDDSLKMSLRLSAARHGRSMEEEARQLLRQSLLREKSSMIGLGSRISQRFAAAGGRGFARRDSLYSAAASCVWMTRRDPA